MYNGHGDVTALLDNAGTIRAGYYYNAFGSVLEHTGVDSSITYAGYQYDKETGLYTSTAACMTRVSHGSYRKTLTVAVNRTL